MELQKDYEELFALLNKYKARYCIIGSYAVAFYSVPRYTKDIDILIEANSENAKKIVSALKEFGFGSTGIKDEDFVKQGFIVQLGYEPVRIDIITSLAGVDFKEIWDNREIGKYGKQEVCFIGRDDLIRVKLKSNRKQDIADIETLKKMKKAYTLVELIVVIAIMTILAALVLPSIRRVREQQKIAQARSTIAIIQSALGKYVVEWGDYPVSGSSFITEALLSTERRGPFITLKPRDILGTGPNRQMKDPWYDGRPNPNSVYQYVYADGHETTGTVRLFGVRSTLKQVYIYSCGPDQTTVSPFGGGDDITSWR